MGRKKAVLALAALAAFAVGVILTHEKARCASVPVFHSEAQPAANIGCGQEQLNPLRKAEYEDMVSLIASYYKDKQEALDFVEKYDDIEVYTKVGEYQDTYVAFVVYRMKILGQYTEVPGLETLRIVRGQDGESYRLEENPVEGLSDGYIQRLLSHEDVKQLFGDTAKAYQEAVGQDALLAEALEDLETAYADSEKESR